MKSELAVRPWHFPHHLMLFSKLSLVFSLGLVLPCHFARSTENTPVPAKETKVPAIAFASEAKGNIFTANEGRILVRFPRPEALAGGKVVLKTEQGVVLESIAVAPGTGELPVPLNGKGFYRVEAEALYPNRERKEATTTAAVVGPKLDEALRMKSRLGLWNVHGDQDLVLSAGGRWNRRMTTLKNLPRDILTQAEPPVTSVSAQRTFTEVGIISFGLPLWLMELPADFQQKGFAAPFQSPKSWEELSQVVQAFVKKGPFGPDFVPYFELYNEPEWAWKGNPDDLVKFEITVADAIKKARPETVVLGPGFSTIRLEDRARTSLDTWVKQGLLDHLDGIVMHAYVDGTPPEGEFIRRVEQLQSFLKEKGKDHFPIHLTEFGWTTAPGGWQQPVDELTQAQYVSRSLTLLAGLGVENATYFCLLYKTPHAGEAGFSIVHDDLTPKPGYAAFANVCHWLAGVEGDGQWLRLSPTTNFMLFRKGQEGIGVLWDVEQKRRIALPGMVTKTEDIMGRTVGQGEDGTLTASPDPLFVVLKDAALYNAVSLKTLRVMQDNSAPLPVGADRQWLVPQPLRISDGRLVAPTKTPEGHYLLLSKGENGWEKLPVEVLTPLGVTQHSFDWPRDKEFPELTAKVQSHSLGAQSVAAVVKFDHTRDYFHDAQKIPPGEVADFVVPLEDIPLGRRLRGKLVVEGREQKMRRSVEVPIEARFLTATRVQGNVPDWSRIPMVDSTDWEQSQGPLAIEDCSAKFQSAYGESGLFLRVQVRDGEHLVEWNPEMLFMRDSLMIGLDPDVQKSWEANDLFALKGHRVFEYGVAGDAAKTITWRWISYLPDLPPKVAEPRLEAKITRKDDLTDYEVFLPWEIMGLTVPPPPGSAIGFALVVNDADKGKSGRRALRLFDGIARDKDPKQFGKLWLR